MMKNAYRLIKSSVARSEIANWAFFICSVIAIGAAIFLLAPTQQLPPAAPLVPVDDFCLQSTHTKNQELPVFTAHVLNDYQAQLLCENLPLASGFSKHFSAVKSGWRMDDEQLQTGVLELRLDLVYLPSGGGNIPESVLSQFYRPVAYYPSYGVFFIMRDVKPELIKEYFYSHKIGLNASNDSRSGYIVPMMQFHKLGLDTKKLNIKRYPSHQDLRDALSRGEVDLISSFWGAEDQRKFPEWKTTQIQDEVSGLKWYLKAKLFENPEIRCSIVDALQSVSWKSGSAYWTSLRIYQDAREGC